MKKNTLNPPAAVSHAVMVSAACFLVPAVPSLISVTYSTINQDLIHVLYLACGLSFTVFSVFLVCLYHGKNWAYRHLRLLFSLSLLSMAVSSMTIPARVFTFDWSGLCNVLIFSGIFFSHSQLGRPEVIRYFLFCRYKKLFCFISALACIKVAVSRSTMSYSTLDSLPRETVTNPL